jgi:hypothetical protein
MSQHPSEYRIESNRPLSGRFGGIPALAPDRPLLVGNRALAVAMAAKSFRAHDGDEIRVVYIPTGEIVFRKQESLIDGP